MSIVSVDGLLSESSHLGTGEGGHGTADCDRSGLDGVEEEEEGGKEGDGVFHVDFDYRVWYNNNVGF